MNIELNGKCSGRYKMQVIRHNEARTESSEIFNGEFDNALLDNFFSYDTIATSGNPLTGNNYPHFGTGTGDTVLTSTQLEAPVITSENRQGNTGSGGYEISTDGNTMTYTHTWVLTSLIGQFVGNISEVGIGDSLSASNNTIYSRSRIKVGGVDGTISITPSDQIVLTYMLSIEFPTNKETTENIKVNGVDQAVTMNYVMGEYAKQSLDRFISSCPPFIATSQAYIHAFPDTANINGPNQNVTNTGGYEYAPMVPSRSVSALGRVYSVTFDGSKINIAGGVSILTWNSGTSSVGYDVVHKLKFTPPLDKTSIRSLTLSFKSKLVRA